MVLPIPITYAGKRYNEVEIRPVSIQAISDAKMALADGDSYRAIQAFISRCVVSVGAQTDAAEIKTLVGQMPYKSAETVAVKILLLGEEDDGIEGVYQCPRCGTKKICAAGDTDTRDFIRDIPINTLDGNTSFSVDISPAVRIDNVDEESVESVDRLTFDHPTLSHCITAFQRYGEKDTVKLQLGIYLEAIVSVNGMPVERKWKNRYGMQVMKDIGISKLREIGATISRYGLQTESTKTCSSCGKEYTVPLNTSSFFVSALAAI